jgi:ADP-ribose pyrophosphatase YjhB (NUDIX family)
MQYPEHPELTAAAVITRGDRIVLILRGVEPGRERWSIPGGHVELGETTRDAVRREVLEECGLVVRPGEIIDVVDYIRRDSEGRVEYHFALVDFLAEYVEGELRAASDVLEARWVTWDEALEADLTGTARAVIEKARDLHGG